MERQYSKDRLSDLFGGVCGQDFVVTDKEAQYSYETDQTAIQRFPFDFLIKPGSAEEVGAILQICNKFGIPVTPRGGGSGVTGGALPVKRGVVLSTERLNRIVSINTIDAFIVAESGVVTAGLCYAVEQAGLYFPIAPSSSAYCLIGGNVAENAGCIQSCQYGKAGDYVLNLEVALASGEVIWTGSNVKKNSTGLNLTQLFVGSEGTLGIITKVVYKLLTKPGREIVMLSAFVSVKDACDALIAIKQSGLILSTAELICRDALLLTAKYLNKEIPLFDDGVEAQLLIGFHSHQKDVDEYGERLAQFLQCFTTRDILVAEDSSGKDRLFEVRFRIGDAMRDFYSGYRDIDMCIPLSNLCTFIEKMQEIGTCHDIPVICFGHALDGNLHTMLLLRESTIQNDEGFRQALQKMYSFGIGIGGVISGEHGIGLLQQEFMPVQFSGKQLSLMKGIKDLFDPNGILNPGKMLNI